MENVLAGQNGSETSIAKQSLKLLGTQEKVDDLFQGFDIEGIQEAKAKIEEAKKSEKRKDPLMDLLGSLDGLDEVVEKEAPEPVEKIDITKEKELLKSTERKKSVQKSIESVLNQNKTAIVVFENEDLFKLSSLKSTRKGVLINYFKTKRVLVYAYKNSSGFSVRETDKIPPKSKKYSPLIA